MTRSDEPDKKGRDEDDDKSRVDCDYGDDFSVHLLHQQSLHSRIRPIKSSDKKSAHNIFIETMDVA
jgi:hypothetical protein